MRTRCISSKSKKHFVGKIICKNPQFMTDTVIKSPVTLLQPFLHIIPVRPSRSLKSIFLFDHFSRGNTSFICLVSKRFLSDAQFSLSPLFLCPAFTWPHYVVGFVYVYVSCDHQEDLIWFHVSVTAQRLQYVWLLLNFDLGLEQFHFMQRKFGV